MTKDPSNNYYAASDFLDKFCDAYLVAGALDHFGMSSIDSQPSINRYENQPNDKAAKTDYVLGNVRGFINKHVMNQILQPESAVSTSKELKCQYCEKKYVRPSYLRKHEQKYHGHVDNTQESSKQDHVYNYTRQVLVLLLLRMNHNNAISLGDGDRVIHLYKFFYLFYKISKCPKYAFATLELLAQINYFLSPRLSYSLTWNRFVNHKGLLDSNHPMDLDVEHDNKSFKTDIHSFRGEITDKSIARVSQSIEATNTILSSYDSSTSVRRPSGRHPKQTNEEDVKIIVEDLQQAEVYTYSPGRCHRAFPNIKSNLLDELDMGKFRLWIKQSMNKFSKKHYYK